MTYISGLNDLIKLKEDYPEYKMILHSDQGSVYASKNYNDLCHDYTNDTKYISAPNQLHGLYTILYLSITCFTRFCVIGLHFWLSPILFQFSKLFYFLIDSTTHNHKTADGEYNLGYPQFS